MDAFLLLAGAISLVAAAIHGAGGEVWVVRRLTPETLPPTRIGGPRMTRTMVHVTWHVTTVAFLTTGGALIAAGSVLEGDAAQGVGVAAAVAATGFALVALGIGMGTQRPRALLSHPGPIVLASAAAFAWLGAL
jgi:hypothetical protein